MRYFNDDMTEEYEEDEDGGNVVVMDDEETLDDLMLPIVVEAILDGRLPVDDEQFQEAAQLGLSLGVVVNTNKGLALARDCVDQNGLALGYAENFDKIRGFGKSLHAPTVGRTIKRSVAKLKGRVATVARGAQAVGGSTSKFLKANSKNVAFVGGALAGGAALRAAMRGHGQQNPSPLVANAEARAEKAMKK
jgi:hypothetical protein